MTAHTETDLQCAVMRYLDVALPKDAIALHIPNGGSRTPIEGARFKRMGVKAGVPDILIVWRGGAYFIELKSAKGRSSEAQLAMNVQLAQAQAPTMTCRSMDEVVSTLKAFGIPSRAQVTA